MKRPFTFVCGLAVVLATAPLAFGVVIDFAGGTATLWDTSTVTTTNTGLWDSVVDYYEEGGMRVDFVNGYGTIGDYYSTGPGGPYYNSVIHAHPFYSIDIVFTKLDGSTFDLNYVDMTSNTVTGGGQSSGGELSYITASNGHSMLLPSSHWGLDYTWYGDPGDGIARLWLDSNFDNITSFTLSSQNAYCFGMDNFFIDEAPPPQVPEPSAFLTWGGLVGLGLVGGWWRKRRSK